MRHLVEAQVGLLAFGDVPNHLDGDRVLDTGLRSSVDLHREVKPVLATNSCLSQLLPGWSADDGIAESFQLDLD